MSTGPFDTDDRSILCQNRKGHDRMSGKKIAGPGVQHIWYSDDGSVVVKWENDYNLGEGE